MMGKALKVVVLATKVIEDTSQMLAATVVGAEVAEVEILNRGHPRQIVCPATFCQVLMTPWARRLLV